MFFNHRRTLLRSSNGHAILPTSKRSASPKGDDQWYNSKGRSRLPRRYGRILIAALFFLTIGAFGLLMTQSEEDQLPDEAFLDPEPNIPPSYSEYHELERRLPQHNLALQPPEGIHAKYFWAPNHVHASGWGNVMQELLLNSHLAYSAKRSFVFDNYTWNRFGPEFSEYNGKLIPSRIPLSAMISGPTVGGPYPAGENVPRAVSKEYFKEVCVSPTVVDTSELNALLSEADADEVLDKWVEKLNSIDDPCVELHIDSGQIFTIWIFGTQRVLSIWPTLIKSPIITQFAWSPLVVQAYNQNKHLLGLPSMWSLTPKGFPSLPTKSQYATIPGLLVLHIRRGDFIKHCEHFANWSSTWNGFNSFPEFIDKFSPPPGGGGGGHSTPENRDFYLKRCFPSIDQMVQKVMEIKSASTGKNLKNIYIMTNGAPAWIEELKLALRKAGKWASITSSRDMRLTKEQKYIAQSVDMLIGQKAHTFVGNGFSSMSSNVVMLRMSRLYPSWSNRFW